MSLFSEMTFFAGVMSIETDDDIRTATFYLMNIAPNRNGWGVTAASMDVAAPTILGAPLNIDMNYAPKGHEGDFLQAAKWVSFDNKGSYLLAKASFTDDAAWELLKAGKIGPISVVINTYKSRCSACNAALPNNYQEALKHGHVADRTGHIVVDSFKFARVDFVDNPAYPQAGMLSMEQMAANYESQSTEYGSQGTQGKTLGDTKLTKEIEKAIKEMTAAVNELKTQVKTNTDKFTALDKTEADRLEAAELAAKAGAGNPESAEVQALKTEMESLRASVALINGSRHATLVREVLDERMKAGIVADPATEKAWLANLDVAQLLKSKDDAIRMAAAVKEQLEAPHAPYTPEEQNKYAAAEDDVSMRLFGRPVKRDSDA